VHRCGRKRKPEVKPMPVVIVEGEFTDTGYHNAP